jgi:uncharacterized protein involved in exopolysaccharide biosynthesis
MPVAPGSIDGFQYVDYLVKRWRVAAVACGMALVLATGISLLLPKRYTSTVRVVIEPPAGADVRSLVAVSPVYMESLKSFLEIASSDQLFFDAAQRFGLTNTSLETLKRSVIKIEIPRDTNILEINSSDHDPVKAHELVDYFAGKLVALNDQVNIEGDEKLVASAEEQLAAARARLDEATSAWGAVVSNAGVESLRGDIGELQRLRGELKALAANTNLEIAQEGERLKTEDAGDSERTRQELRTNQTGARELDNQIRAMDGQIAAKQALLDKRAAEQDKAEAERKEAQTVYEAMDKRLGEVRAAAGSRGERLRIIDSGVVPDRPSSPNVTLNIVAALLAAAVLSLLYLTLEFNYRLHKAAHRTVPFRVASHD